MNKNMFILSEKLFDGISSLRIVLENAYLTIVFIALNLTIPTFLGKKKDTKIHLLASFTEKGEKFAC